MDFREFFNGKIVLVTGHTGFKGAWLSLWLNDMGAKVIGYALNPEYEDSLFKLTNLKDKIVDIRADIRDLNKLDEIFREHKPDIVIHLAAQAIVRVSYDIPVDTFTTNIIGTVNVLECLKKYQTKSAVLITSDKCYKNIEQEEGYKETDAFSDKDPYSCSKGCAEMVTQSYRNSFGIKVATTRAGNVIGGGDWAVNRIVPDIIKSIKKNEKIIIRNPKSTRPWQFILEPLRGYLMIAKKLYEKEELNEGFNFGPNKESIIPVINLAQLIIKKWGSGEIEIQKDDSNKHEAGLLYLDSTKIREKIGWKAELDINQVADYIVDWYKNYESEDVYQLSINQIHKYETEIDKTNKSPKCRFCGNELKHEFIDLVNSPPSNSYLTREELTQPEKFYPLKIYVCEKCFLVQIDEYKKSRDIFNKDYAYFSSYSKDWVKHAKEYVNMMTERFGFNKNSFIIEIGSNDGYLLQFFKEKEIPCLGIEPASNTAKAAREKGIETIEKFFDVDFAKKFIAEKGKPDLILGINMLAHNPNINNFIKSLKIALKDTGIVTMEFPHLIELVSNNQFDTIYHEHYSYFSFSVIKKIFEQQGFEIFDVEEFPELGGLIRIYVKHREDHTKNISERVQKLLDREKSLGMDTLDYYKTFKQKVDKVKYDLLQFLIEQKQADKTVVAYGAAAKGNTLLNYCGIKKDLINFVVDKSPHKQGKFLPGSHIPIVNEDLIKKEKPDYVLILPWNLKKEIMEQLNYIRDWGARFVIPIPSLEIA